MLGARILLPDVLVHEYVTAILDIGRQELSIVHSGRRLKRVPFPLED